MLIIDDFQYNPTPCVKIYVTISIVK